MPYKAHCQTVLFFGGVKLCTLTLKRGAHHGVILVPDAAHDRLDPGVEEGAPLNDTVAVFEAKVINGLVQRAAGEGFRVVEKGQLLRRLW